MNETLAMQRHAEMQLMSLRDAQTRNSGQEVRVDTIEVVEIATYYPQSVRARRIQPMQNQAGERVKRTGLIIQPSI